MASKEAHSVSDTSNLKVHSVTFNTGTHAPPNNKQGKDKVEDIFNLNQGQDLIAVGFQEIHARPDKFLADTLGSGQDEWSKYVTEILVPHGFLQVRRIRVINTVLTVFCHKKHLQYIREVDTSWVRLDYLGVKASVAVRLRLLGVSFCFVNAHFAAHDHKLDLRVENYRRTVEELKFSQEQAESNALHHDYVVLMGDLNFRLREGTFDFSEIHRLVEAEDFEQLLAQDQLKQVQQEERALHELFETEITFPPTYKFKVGREEYDAKRRPAWTDRILHRCNHLNSEKVPLNLTATDYTSHPAVRTSDHIPVSCSLEAARVDPALQAQLRLPAYGPMVRFHKPRNWRVGFDGVVSYLVDIGTIAYLNTWDYIALFKADFTSLEDYVTFTWASACRRTGVEKNAVIMEEAIQSPGMYKLIYFGHRNCVLGVSEDFEIGPNPSLYIEVAEEASEALRATNEESVPLLEELPNVENEVAA